MRFFQFVLRSAAFTSFLSFSFSLSFTFVLPLPLSLPLPLPLPLPHLPPDGLTNWQVSAPSSQVEGSQSQISRLSLSGSSSQLLFTTMLEPSGQGPAGGSGFSQVVPSAHSHETSGDFAFLQPLGLFWTE